MTALFQKVVPDIEAIGSRLGAVAPALLHASANRTPTTRPVQELQAPSLSEGLQTVLQELQLPQSISTSSKGSWWSTADEALAYNGLAVVIVCILSYATLRILMACAPVLRQRVLQPRPLSSSEWLVYWWNSAFWRPDKGSDTAMDRDVMQIRAGLEAAMLMRYASFMIRFLLVSGLVALPLLLPLFASAAPLAPSGFGTLSMLHVPDGSPRLAAAAVVAFVLTFLHMGMAAREWRAFGRERHAWLRQDVGAHQAAVVVQCHGRGAAMLGPLELQRLLESALQAAGCEGHNLRACAELPATTPLALLSAAFHSPRDLPPRAAPDTLLAEASPTAPPRAELSWCEARLTRYSKHFLVLLGSRAAAATCVAMPSAQLLGLQLHSRVMPLERHMFWEGLLFTRSRTATALAAAARASVLLLLLLVVFLLQSLPHVLEHVLATHAALRWLQPYQVRVRVRVKVSVSNPRPHPHPHPRPRPHPHANPKQGTLGWALLMGVIPSLLLLLCTLAVAKSGLPQALERLRAPPTHAAIQARSCALLMAVSLLALLLALLLASPLGAPALLLGLGAHGQRGAPPAAELGASQHRFWMHYLASDALLLNAEVLLLLPLATELLQRMVQCCSNTFGLRSPGGRRWADDELRPERHGTLTAAYARCFFVGALGLLFAPAAPCLLLASLGYLLLFQPLWARNLAQAYAAPRADTGGRLWVEAMRYTAYALALSNLALCAALASRGCPYAALSVGFLPLLTLRAERRTRGRHLLGTARAALQTAADLDAASPVDVHAPDAFEPQAPLILGTLLDAQQRSLQQALCKMGDLEAGAAISKGEMQISKGEMHAESSPLQTFVGSS